MHTESEPEFNPGLSSDEQSQIRPIHRQTADAMAECVELMLLVAVVFVWSGLTVCYGRSSEAIAHCRAAEGCSSQTKRCGGRGARTDMRAAPSVAIGGTAPSRAESGCWNNRDCFLF